MTFRALSITLVCVVLGVILAWQYKSIYYNSKMESTQIVRLDNLKDDILEEKKKNEKLQAKLKELEEQKRQYDEAVGNNTLLEANLKKELDVARLIAGLTDVKGKGIVVTIDNTSEGEVADTDILNIINELKASEAQALSVNNERIVSLSEVRKAGNYIVINGKQITPPYTIRAIANPSKLENALGIVGGIAETYEEIYKIKLSIEKVDELFIPKVDSSIFKTDYLEVIK